MLFEPIHNLKICDSLKVFFIIRDDTKSMSECCCRNQYIRIANQFPSFAQISIDIRGFKNDSIRNLKNGTAGTKLLKRLNLSMGILGL